MQSLYIYCLNNPVNAIDLNGNWISSISKGLCYVCPKINLAYANYYYNIKHDITSGFIYNQERGKVANMRYGIRKMSYNGCELIAIYNALKLKNRKASLAQIAFEFEINDGTLLWGDWGTNWYIIGSYLKFHGVNYKSTSSFSTLKSLATPGKVLIISFWNDSQISHGVHTVAIKCNGKNSFTVYNRGYYSSGPESYNSLDLLLGKGKFIFGYCL